MALKSNLVSNLLKISNFKYFFILLLCLAFSGLANAKNYYFSSSAGDDAYSSTQAQNPSTPWRTITKLNSFFSSVAAGDSILFKRGDTFFGSVIVTKSGTSSAPIIFSAYGSGNRPVISGLVTLSSWTSVGSGIYQCAAPSVKTTVNLVTLNGKPQQIGRYPNADAANGGYLTYESYGGTSSITDNQLTSATNWTGAEVVIRKQHYLLERCKITSHSGSTITYSPTTTINPANGAAVSEVGTNGFGYFIQRDARTLDQFGEWYFEPTGKNMQMYFGSGTPSSYTIKASAADTLINISSNKYISISEIAFEGGNMAAVFAKDAANISIQNCDMNTMGAKGIFIFNTPNTLVENINTNYILSNAIDITGRAVSSATVRGCNIKNTAYYAGMGSYWDNAEYKGIYVSVSNNALLEYNSIDTTGYIALHFQGSNIMVKNNYINYYDFIKDDGGGIYTYTQNSETFTNRTVRNNIVLNGIGAAAGTNDGVDVDGIFLDGATMNVNVLANSVANIGANGIYCNNPSNVKIDSNTVFNNGSSLGITRYSTGPDISNLTITNNVLYPKYDNQSNFSYSNNGLNIPTPVSIQTAMQSLGLIEKNYCNTPDATGFDYNYVVTQGGAYTFAPSMSFEGWKAFTGHDLLSKLPPKKIPSYTLNNLIGSNTITNGQFTSDISSTSFYVPNGNSTTTWDNTSKITGTGSLKLTPTTSSTEYTFVYKTVGAITASKKYILRFSTLGATKNGIVNAYIRQTNSPYGTLCKVQTKTFGNSRVDHEFLFTATASDANATAQIEIQQASGATYLDNIEFYEANATTLDINTQLRFEYNATNSPKSIILDANYLGVDSSLIRGTLTLLPYTSKILIKDTGVVTQAPSTLAAAATATAVKCFGGTTTVNVTASGGTAPYTGTGAFSVGAGSYNYTVRDAAGASATATISVTQPSSLQVSATAGIISLIGGITTVTVSATGGVPPYSGVGLISSVSAGIYTYTVTDANGCTASKTITITEPNTETTGTLQATASASNIVCYGEASTVNVTATGGTAPYTGTGSSTVTAGIGTLKLSFPTSVATEYTSLYSSVGAISSSKNYVLKFTTLGTTSAGFLRVYLRQTNTPFARISANIQSASFGTARTDHQFIFAAPTTDANGSFVIEIAQNSGITYIDNIAFFASNISGTLIGSNLYSAGNFETDISNITAWSANNNQTVAWDNTGKINNTYYYTVRDAIGATSTALVTAVQATAALAVSAIVPTPISVVGGSTNVVVSATGGIAPYTGTGTFSATAGVRTYTVTDANGCSVSTTITISEPSSPLLASSPGTSINCFGGSSAVTVSASGGKIPYTGTGTFTVTAGVGSLKLSFPSSIATVYSSLYASFGAVSSSKNYIVRFSTLGTISSGALRVFLRQSASPYTVLSTALQTATFGATRVNHEFLFKTPASDANASFVIEVLQNSGTTYIDNVAVFESTTAGVPIGSNLFSNGQFESNIANISAFSSNNNQTIAWDNTSKIANTYYYTVTDAAGATSTTAVTASQPSAALQASAAAGTITVTGGTANVVVTATGGTAPYAGTGTFAVRAGTYTYTITDAKGCTTTTSVTLTEPASLLLASATAGNIVCFGGSSAVTVAASGGTAPYTGTGSFTAIAGTGTLALSFPTSVANVYTSLVSSSIGPVSSTKNYAIRFTTLGTTSAGFVRAYLRQTASPYTVISSNLPSASFGLTRVDHQFIFPAPTTQTDASFVIEVLQNSGTTYIDNIALFECTAGGTLIGANLFTNSQFNTDISGITPWSPNNNQVAAWNNTSKINNVYYYTVRDAIGATSVAIVNTSQASAALQASASAGTITVAGGTTSVTVSATGGVPPYTGTGTFSSVAAGTYNYTVTDANGCTASTSVTITQPSGGPLVAGAAASRINCFGGTSTITVNATGGSAPYTGTGSFTGVSAGVGTLKISFPSSIAINYTSVMVSVGAISSAKTYVVRFTTLGSSSNGFVRAYLRQTGSPYTVLSSTLPSASFNTARVDHQFIFTAPATNAAASFVIEVRQNSGVTYIDNLAFFEATSTGTLIGSNVIRNGQFETDISNVTIWSSNNNQVAVWDNTSKINNSYYYAVTDAVGAKSTAFVTASQPATALKAAATAGTITTVGGTATVTVSATGGTAPYTGTGNFTVNAAGVYNYTVRDANFCISSVSVTVASTAARIASPATTTSTTLARPTGQELSVTVFPNPATTEFGLLVESNNSETVEIFVKTADGKTVYQTKGTSNRKYNFGNNLLPGIYFIQVLQGKQAKVVKAVKTKF